MDYDKRFLVKPGARVHLAKVDPASFDGAPERERALAMTGDEVARIAALQYLLYANASRSLLIVLQGVDAAGKDGVIRHLFSSMNPQGVKVHAFKQPTPDEAAHDFLWRVHVHAPGRGEVAIFNRSHYEDVIVPRVHKTLSKAEIAERFALINDFEAMIAANGGLVLKFLLHISPEEQLARFKQRLDDPARQWKISESDYTERELWPRYIKAYETAIEATSTPAAPWRIIPANHKWFRNLAISHVVADALAAMKLSIPPPRADLADIRRKYYAAAYETQMAPDRAPPRTPSGERSSRPRRKGDRQS